jgi:hypothetical protein
MNIVSFFAGAGGLTLDFKKQDLMLFGQMNMTKKFGKLMKKTIRIQFLTEEVL